MLLSKELRLELLPCTEPQNNTFVSQSHCNIRLETFPSAKSFGHITSHHTMHKGVFTLLNRYHTFIPDSVSRRKCEKLVQKDISPHEGVS